MINIKYLVLGPPVPKHDIASLWNDLKHKTCFIILLSLKKKKVAFANEAINIDVFLRSPRALSFLQLTD